VGQQEVDLENGEGTMEDVASEVLKDVGVTKAGGAEEEEEDEEYYEEDDYYSSDDELPPNSFGEDENLELQKAGNMFQGIGDAVVASEWDARWHKVRGGGGERAKLRRWRASEAASVAHSVKTNPPLARSSPGLEGPRQVDTQVENVLAFRSDRHDICDYRPRNRRGDAGHEPLPWFEHLLLSQLRVFHL
jgi:hypothetical protein